MNRTIVLRCEAEREFDEAFDWYNAKRGGLGAEFVSEVQEVFNRISTTPLMHPIVFADIRKGVVRRFPYCIFYRPHPETVEVLAVFHSSRDPSVWHRRA